VSAAPASDTRFIQKEFDEFRDLTTITHRKTLKCGGAFGRGGVHNTYTFQLRMVKRPAGASVLLDCDICAEDWFHARSGKIIFNCDQQNVSADYEESRTDVQTIGNTAYCFEYGYYRLSEEVLERIGACEVLKIRISGGSVHEEPNAKWCREFQTYCRQFYNNAIDPSRFTESLGGGGGAGPSGSSTAREIGYDLGQAASGKQGFKGLLKIGALGLICLLALVGLFLPRDKARPEKVAVAPASEPAPAPVPQAPPPPPAPVAAPPVEAPAPAPATPATPAEAVAAAPAPAAMPVTPAPAPVAPPAAVPTPVAPATPAPVPAPVPAPAPAPPPRRRPRRPPWLRPPAAGSPAPGRANCSAARTHSTSRLGSPFRWWPMSQRARSSCAVPIRTTRKKRGARSMRAAASASPARATTSRTRGGPGRRS